MAFSLQAVFGMDSKGFRQDLKSVRKSLNSNVKGFFNLGAAAKSFLQIVSVGAFIKLGRDALAMAAKLDAAAGKLGLTTDLIQELGFAGEQFGVKSDTTSMALQRFTRRLGEAQQGTGEMLPVIKQYGIEVKNMDGTMRSAEDVFRDYVDVIGKAKTPQEQLRLSFKAFDSEGVALVNVLKDGTKGLDEWAKKAQESGTIMEESTIKSLAAANNEIKNFTDSLTVAAGEIIVNFRTKEGLELMGLQFTKIITQFGAMIADAVINNAKLFFNVMGGAAKGAAGVLQNALIVALQAVALKANEFLPSKWEFDVVGLEKLKSASQGFGAEITRAIATTEPSKLRESVGASFDDAIAKQKVAAKESIELKNRAGAAELTAQQKHDQAVYRRAQDIRDKQDASNKEFTENLKKGAEEITVAADSLESSFTGFGKSVNQLVTQIGNGKGQKNMLSGVSAGSLNSASDASVREVLSRALSALADNKRSSLMGGPGSELAFNRNAANIQRTIQNAEREISFRDRFRRSVARGGESAAFREFQNIDPLQIDALLDQFTRNRSESERSADGINDLVTGLRRRGIIPGA